MKTWIKLVFLLLAWVGIAQAACPAGSGNVIQSCEAQVGAATTGSAFGANVTAGNTILLLVNNTASVCPSPLWTISDTSGDTFNAIGTCGTTTGSTTQKFCASGVAGGAETVFATGGSGSGSAADFVMYELHGYTCNLDPNGGDVNNAVAGPTTSPASGQLTTTNANDIFFVYAAQFNASSGPTAYSGFTQQTSSGWAGSSGYFVASATQTNLSTTGSGASNTANWMVTLTALEASGGGGPNGGAQVLGTATIKGTSVVQ